MPTPQPMPPSDDELDELPPVDGGEEIEPEADYTDMVEDEADDDDPLDDKTGEDDPVGTEDSDTEGSETGWLNDAEGNEDLDVGTSDLSSFDGEGQGAADFEELGVGDEDFGLNTIEDRAGLDGGEEGPTADDDALKDEELPPLDADEEGEMDEADLVDPSFAPEAEEARLAWSSHPWSTVGAPLDVGPVSAIVCAGRGVLFAGAEGLARGDLEGAYEPLDGKLPGRALSLVSRGARLVALTEGGEVLASEDSGASFARVAEAMKRVVASEGELALVSRRAELFASKGAAKEPLRGPLATGVLAVAEDGQELVALFADSGGAPAVVARGVLRGARVDVGLEPELVVGRLTLAARGACVALAGERGLARTLDGARFSPVHGVDGVVAMTFLDDLGTLLAAVYREADDATWLVRVPVEGAPEIVAELEAPRVDEDGDDEGPKADGASAGPDGCVRAMARDDAHGVVWVAGGFGLVAFDAR